MIFEQHYSEITPKSSKGLKAEEKRHRYFAKRLKRLKKKKERLEKKKERLEKKKEHSKKYYFCVKCNILFQRDFKEQEYVPQTHEKKFIFARQALCINCAKQNEILRFSIKNEMKMKNE